MGEANSFSNSFWGEDFTSSDGFDALSKILHDGKAFCKDMESYLKARAKMEQDYSKSLGKLYQSLKFKGETGVLEKTWEVFRCELAQMAKIHDDCGKYFQQLEQETKKYIDEYSVKRKEQLEKTKRSHQNKLSACSKAASLQKTYHQKCKESDLATETYHSLKQAVTTTSKELEKGRSANEKAQENAQKADEAYKASIDALENARKIWEEDMEIMCKVFQTMEEGRINFIRDLLWTCCNLDSRVAVEIDDCCEHVRAVLDNCDIGQDIQKFIDKYQTGTIRPHPIPYENFYRRIERL